MRIYYVYILFKNFFCRGCGLLPSPQRSAPGNTEQHSQGKQVKFLRFCYFFLRVRKKEIKDGTDDIEYPQTLPYSCIYVLLV